MPGYLDQYGAGEEQRNRIVFRSIAAVVAIVVLGSLSWYLLKNHHQESVVKTFVSSLRKGDYQGAYRAWGCTSEKPCTAYPYASFMRDWGPTAGSAANAGLSDSESCNTGVLLTLNMSAERVEKLWVDKSNDAINFAPYPICPHKNPFAIMLHRTIGRLRKPLLN
jgi:hypothetical protein